MTWNDSEDASRRLEFDSSHLTGEGHSPGRDIPIDDFPAAELTNALTEQSFGTTSFKIVLTGPLEAAARVVLLEGTALNISLSSQGYKIGRVDAKIGEAGSPTIDETFESLEALLTSVSPRYATARQNALFARLQALSDSRSSDK
ncbi:hypothetical protein WOLCODRAFT_98042 [Wolfiporia cocos MD-104 SS10]|uniref:GSKIP domain-containing protein n=1 Tax=Wolfiporia cocos (strain MD-104) TaxID=742152 RepID=A0A2H3JJA1_WOLCO|nr:hypothetical protein WOLCODRAFT_98042 [Wolfiporia cocos MD-104 SS10]